MAIASDISKRMSRHLQNADMVRTMKQLDEYEQHESSAKDDLTRVALLSREFAEIDKVDNYLKIKLARVSAFIKHEEGIIKAQLNQVKDAKKKIKQSIAKLPRDPTSEPSRVMYEANIAKLQAAETQLSGLLRRVQEFRKVIRKSCLETIRTAAKIRWWA